MPQPVSLTVIQTLPEVAAVARAKVPPLVIACMAFLIRFMSTCLSWAGSCSTSGRSGVSFSVIGAFYYLRVIWLMYFDRPVASPALQAGVDMRIVLTLNGLLILALGLFPGRILELCTRLLG